MPRPSVPERIEDTGLEFGFLADMALKTVYRDIHCTTERAAERLCLPMSLTETLLQQLYRENLVDIKGAIRLQNHRYGMLERGWQRVQRVMEVNGYMGPAPVALDQYSEAIRRQAKSDGHPNLPGAVASAFADLVLPEDVLHTAGLVVSSRRSLFLSGPAGNGKTTIAQALHLALGGEIWIPYAVEVDGQVIKVYDAHNHVAAPLSPGLRYDRRWIKIERPLVVVGGELTIEAMDLNYSETLRFYEAPSQIKSNGGTLVIDDFGRQRVKPQDLLNRWIIPLENQVDYLTLHTGKKIQVPFQQLLIFATNLDPATLVDDAFLRRMGYRLYVEPPGRETYERIFRLYMNKAGLTFDPDLLGVLWGLYERDGRSMKGCEPRDLIARCLDVCRYEGRPAGVNAELLEIAWRNYFGLQRPKSS